MLQNVCKMLLCSVLGWGGVCPIRWFLDTHQVFRCAEQLFEPGRSMIHPAGREWYRVCFVRLVGPDRVRRSFCFLGQISFLLANQFLGTWSVCLDPLPPFSFSFSFRFGRTSRAFFPSSHASGLWTRDWSAGYGRPGAWKVMLDPTNLLRSFFYCNMNDILISTHTHICIHTVYDFLFLNDIIKMFSKK